MKNSGGPLPIVKWAGGKAWVADRVRALLPARISGTYHEPFAGGLAVFASLRPEQLPLFDEPGRQHVPAHRAHLVDLSADLVAFYEVVRDEPEELIRLLAALRDDYLRLPPPDAVKKAPERAEFYYEVRSAFNRSKAISDLGGGYCPPEERERRAAWYLFLNKTGFNGLMRYSQRGELNTPHGRYVAPRVFVADHLRAFSRALRGTVLRCADFEPELVSSVRPGDAIYLDPPHATRSATSRFTAYTDRPWREEDDARVARVFWDLADRGARVVLSQADTPRAHEILRSFRPPGAQWVAETVYRSGSISCRGGGRQKVGEILAAAGPSTDRTVGPKDGPDTLAGTPGR